MPCAPPSEPTAQTSVADLATTPLSAVRRPTGSCSSRFQPLVVRCQTRASRLGRASTAMPTAHTPPLGSTSTALSTWAPVDGAGGPSTTQPAPT